MADSAPLQFGKINFFAWLNAAKDRDIGILVNAGAPVDGTAGTGTGADKAGPGCLLIDYTNKFLYINTGTKASVVWTKVGTQS